MILLTALCLIEAVQLLLLLLRFWALPPLAVFCVFILIVLAGLGVVICLLKDRFNSDGFHKGLCLFVVIEGALTACLLESAFKQIVYDYQPQLAKGAFDAVMAAAILNKIFWPKVKSFLFSFYAFLIEARNRRGLSLLIDAGMVIFVIVLIYVPDVHGVIARMFIGEQFHHWDFFMAPAWDFLKGGKPFVDVISQYGVGVPVVMGFAGKLLGGFSYERIFILLMSVCIIYYICVYVFLRAWIVSIPICLFAMFVGIKIQMFHPGINPFVMTYPSSIVMRNVFDILFFLVMLGHLRHGKDIYMWAAAVLCALAVFNLTDTGVYLTAAFYAYILMQVTLPPLKEGKHVGMRDWLKGAGYVFCVPVLVLMLFYAVVGRHVFTPLFWYNMQEYIIYFLAGPGMYPMTENMRYHFFWNTLVSIVMPLVYLSSILFIGILSYWRKIDRIYIIVIILGVYGLGLYHYYVARSVMTSFYVSGLPFVFVMCFWFKMALERLKQSWHFPVKIGAVILSFFALMTTHQVSAYPNLINFSRNPLVDTKVTLPFPDLRRYFNHLYLNYGPENKTAVNSLGGKDEWLVTQADFSNDMQVKRFYDQEFNFAQDAALIAKLTAPGERTAVLSSFEVKLLMQADRPAFFYFTPLLVSRPMHMRMFPLENVHSAAYLTTTMKQLKESPPRHIFMERIFLQNDLPQAYQRDIPRLLVILDYIRKNYEPFAYGKYLVAMKIK